jgi:hypothetical protein
MWAEPLERGTQALPKTVLGAMLGADKIIAHYPANRTLLEEQLKGTGIIHIGNWSRDAKLMSSEQARYHSGMVRAIGHRMEEVFRAAQRWTVTAPNGTNISGRIVRESEVADAFFVEDAAGGRYLKTFPGAVYAPIGSADAEGTIVANHINQQGDKLWDEPAFISVRQNRVVDIEGGPGATELQARTEERAHLHGEKATILDSFHGGLNPKSQRPTPESTTVDWTRMGSTPALIHFHVGRLKSTLSTGVSFHTLYADDKEIIEAGRLAVLNDPELVEAAECLGVTG